MSEHTPGPWERVGLSVGVEKGSYFQPVANVLWVTEDRDGPTIPNACLIAAAPEMLDVLRQWKNAESTSDDAELRCARFARDQVLAKCEGGAE